MKLGVWNDYGRLREVAVGMAENAVVPGYSDAFPPFAQELTRKYAGQPADSVPGLDEMMALTQGQLDHLARVYRDHGVIVHRPRKYTKEESGYQNELQVGDLRVFPADPIWVIGRNIIECQFRQPYRNKERFPLRDMIAKRIDEDPNLRMLSCPVTMPNSGDFVLEGGDIQICGNEGMDVLVGVDDERSSSANGVEWLRRRLAEDGYTVTPVPIIKAAPVHLLGAMGVFGPTSAMIYRPAFINGIPKPMKDWDLIDITLEEAEAGGPCAVMLDPDTILMVAEVPRLVDLLEKRGLKVITMPFDAVTKLDGAIRCATFVIHRDKN